jgi:Fe2+ transport system protein FeoA
MTLNDLPIGGKGSVLTVNNHNKELRRRILDMGITPGVIVEIKKVSPLQDPVDIKVRGYELCLRRDDLKQIEIEVVK